jgi:hypothetical protein
MATATASELKAQPIPALLSAPTRVVAVSYLRAFVTLLVVAHHAVLVYTTLKPPRLPSFTTQPRYWLFLPVAEPSGWGGFDLFVGWNDIFFMPLMFFVSGIFVWTSLKQKGAATFLKRRLLRVGLPFVVGAAMLGPLMYYPAFVQFGGHGFMAYAKVWFSLGNWPSGPLWFLWVLLLFDCLASVAFVVAPRVFEFLGKVFGETGQRPILFFLALVAFSQVAYLPMVWKLGPYGPLIFGPFFVQGTKLFVYLVYFFAGIGAGVFGSSAGLFERTGRLARRWPLWGVFSLLCFAAWIGAYVAGKSWLNAVVFSFSCAATSLFVTAVFVRFASGNRVLDSFSANAYGIYMVHYVFLVWVQWMLLGFALPVLLKGILALALGAVLSWVASALLRRNSRIAHVI